MKKAVVVDGTKIEIREIMTCVYTFDHRQGDAAIMLQFLNVMKDLLEDPENFNPDNYTELPSYEELAKRRTAKKTQ